MCLNAKTNQFQNLRCNNVMFNLIYKVVSQKIRIIGSTDFPKYTKLKVKDNNH